MRLRTLRYVTYDDIPDYLALGWIVLPRRGWMYHDLFGGVMEWLCDCKLVEPLYE
jgi:hypothetical protein